MTDNERKILLWAAQIAAEEAHYWGAVECDDPFHVGLVLGALGAAANISAALFMGKTVEQVRTEIQTRNSRLMEGRDK